VCWLSVSASALLLVGHENLILSSVDAFGGATVPRWRTFHTAFRRSRTELFYVDDESSSSRSYDDQTVPASGSSSVGSDEKEMEARNPFTIPVIGPLPGNPPLLIGAELFLNVPTPLQWQALEEACHIHQAHLKDSSVAGIDTAPLVAILDEYTSGTRGGSGKKAGGRYATIAAVLGVTTSKRQRLDLTDSGSFMESLSALQRSSLPQEGKIRLLGIGRANLEDFFYRVPSGVLEDEDGMIATDDYDDDDYYEDDGDETEMCEEVPNVVMARFRLVLDDGSLHSDQFAEQRRERSRHSSPVHALAEMSSLARKLQYLHADRIHLVNGIKAALLRYRRAESARSLCPADGFHIPSKIEEEDDDLVDYDGFGALFAQKELEATQPAMDRLLSEFVAADQEEVVGATSEEPRPPLNLKMSEENNYGMGRSACSISNLSELTEAGLERLRPYYSPARCEMEEHYYEVLSFAAVQAVSDVVGPHELGRALQGRNTQERLQLAYDWMFHHVADLRQDAQTLRQQLLDCGEECTDLF
jgi:hypothetical protein